MESTRHFSRTRASNWGGWLSRLFRLTQAALYCLCFIGVIPLASSHALSNRPIPLPDGTFVNQDALHAFSMTTADLLLVNLPFKKQTVINKGSLVGKWGNCSATSSISSCHVFPRFEDRISFAYKGGEDYELEYIYPEPTVRAVKGSAKPIVTNFNVDSRGGVFTVLFRCTPRDKPEDILLELIVTFLPHYSSKIFFYKKCGAGKHPYINLEDRSPTGTTVVHSIPHLVVDEASSVSTLHMEIVSPARAQVYGVPVLRSSDTGVHAELRGLTPNGTLTHSYPISFSIIYSCYVVENATVSLQIPIPPWKSLTLKFLKKCGSAFPPSLEVGSAANLHDVVFKGVSAPKYFVKQPFRNAERESVLMKVPGNVSRSTFIVRNVQIANAPSLYLMDATVSIERRGVVIVSQEYGSWFGMQDLQRSVLRPGASEKLALRYRCLQEGSSIVLVTIPILNYRPVEFGFMKICTGRDKPPCTFLICGIEDIVLWAVLAGLIILAVLLRKKGLSHFRYKLVGSSDSYR